MASQNRAVQIRRGCFLLIFVTIFFTEVSIGKKAVFKIATKVTKKKLSVENFSRIRLFSKKFFCSFKNRTDTVDHKMVTAVVVAEAVITTVVVVDITEVVVVVIAVVTVEADMVEVIRHVVAEAAHLSRDMTEDDAVVEDEGDKIDIILINHAYL